MSDLKLNFPNRVTSFVRQGGTPGHARTLQHANREALRQLGCSVEATSDAKGRVLRQLRLQLGLDPSVLATQACMSLSQLYELEDGGHSRFYSASLRRQAGRRVAQLLGANWDQIGQDDLSTPPGNSNVVPLQRPAAAPASMTPNTAPVAEAPRQGWPAPEPVATVHAKASPEAPASHDEQAVPMGLATPALETLLADTPKTSLAEPAEPAPAKSSMGSTFVVFLVVVVMGAAGGYAFVEYSPYYLYWPW